MKRGSIQFIDYDAEKSTTSVRVSDDLDMEGFEELAKAIADVSVGMEARRTLSEIVVMATPADTPEDENVQRESKWLVRAWDESNYKPVNFEIPCANLGLLEERSNRLDIYTEESEGEELKEQIEEKVLSSDGNSISVLEIVHVGRNT